jgi:protein with PEP-CTERM/exosortase system signal
MNKIKYIAAVVIGIAGLGLQQVNASSSTLNTFDNNGTFQSGNWGTVTWTLSGQTATFTFTAGGDAAFFLDGKIADLSINSTSFTVDTSATPGITFPSTGGSTVNGYGDFNLTTTGGAASNHFSTITFSVTNTSATLWATSDDVLKLNGSGFDAAAHVFSTSLGTTIFVGEIPGGGGVPDGGTTVMLLGMGLGALGMVRRYLKT